MRSAFWEAGCKATNRMSAPAIDTFYTLALTASVLLSRLLSRARLRHLQLLVKVAELGSFRKAGEAVGMAQPSVTHVVSDLENLLGVELFQRHARGVTPTPFCEELLPVARRMIQALSLGLEAVAARMSRAQGSVRLGASAAAISGLLAQTLPAFNDHHPEVQVHLAEVQGDALGLLIERGEADLVACRQPAIVPEGWAFAPLLEDCLVVACGTDHPLAGKQRLKLADLAQETWLAPPLGTAGRRVLDELLARHDMPLRYARMSTVAVTMTWAFLARKGLVTLMPYSVAKPLVEARQLAVLALQEALPLEPLGLLSPQEPPGPAAQALVEFLAAAYRVPPPQGGKRRSTAA